MPQLIQNVPAGLLGLLRLTGGEAPKWLLDAIGGNLDMLPFYLARNRTDRATVPTNVGAVNTGVQLVVPANEFWLVESINCSLTATAAGQVAGIQLGYQLVAGGNMSVVAYAEPGLATLPAIGDFIQIGYWFGGRLILPPGAAVAGQVARAIGAPVAPMVVSAVISVLSN